MARLSMEYFSGEVENLDSDLNGDRFFSELEQKIKKDGDEIIGIDVGYPYEAEPGLDVSCLSGLTQAKYVELGGNIVGDMSALTDYENVESLYLSCLHLTGEASTIAKYEKLRDLTIIITPRFTGEASAMATLENLEYVSLSQTGLTGKLSDFANLKKLKRVTVSDEITGQPSDIPGGFDATKAGQSPSDLGVAVYRHNVTPKASEPKALEYLAKSAEDYKVKRSKMDGPIMIKEFVKLEGGGTMAMPATVLPASYRIREDGPLLNKRKLQDH